MPSTYGSTDAMNTNSRPAVQPEPAPSQRPSNNGHYHVMACLFIVVAPVSLYSLLNVTPLINNPPSNKADDINFIRITAVVIYSAACLVIVLFMAKYIHANREDRVRADENELATLYPRERRTSRGSTCIRDIVLTTLFLGSFIHILFTLLTNEFDTASTLLFAFSVLFCILQLPLVLYFRGGRSDRRINMYLLAFVTTGNACNCVECVTFSFLLQKPNTHQTYNQKVSETVGSVLYMSRVHYAVLTTFMLFTNMTFRSGIAPDSLNEPRNAVGNRESDRNRTSTPLRDTMWRKAKHYLTATLRFISHHSLYFSLIYCAFLMSVNIAEKAGGGHTFGGKHGNHSNHNTSLSSMQIDMMYHTIATWCAYAASVVDFIVLIFAGLESSVVSIQLADKVLILVSVSSCVTIYMIGLIIDAKYLCNLSQPEPALDVVNFVLVKLFLNLEMFFQTAFILKVSGLRPVSPLTLNQVFVRGTVVFLCVFNVTKWIHDSFLFSDDYSMFTANAEAVKAWYGLALPIYSIASIYRLFSAILCYEILLSYPRE